MSAAPKTGLPFSIRLFFVLSWLLGCLLVWDGLHQRLWNAYWQPDGLMPWVDMARAWNLSPLDVGWPFVVAGLSLIGASFGLYLKRQWGYAVGVAVCVLALGYVALGAALAVACLVVLALPSTRAHVQLEIRRRDVPTQERRI